MNKLVEIRVADALESIERIEDAMNRARERRDKAQKIVDELKANVLAADLIIKLNALVLRCRQICENPELPWQVESETVAAAETAYKVLLARLSDFHQRTKALAGYRIDLNVFDQHKARAKEKLQEKRLVLRHISDTLASPQFDPAESLKTIEENKPCWGEQIESVAGVVLRDDEFDNGLSVHADNIIRFCADNAEQPGYETLNVLGRDQAVRHDPLQTVYFRFPTWSVWGIPLIAHDFWDASNLRPDGIKVRLGYFRNAQKMLGEPLVRNCLADAFATYAIGPAYAYACIALRLDANSPGDLLRAETIFSTLDYLASDDLGTEAFVSGLKDDWDRARGAFDGQAAQAPHCLLHRNCHIVEKALDDYWKARESACDSAGAVQRLAETLASTNCSWSTQNEQCPMKDSRAIEEMRDALLESLRGSHKFGYNVDQWDGVDEQISNFIQHDNVPVPDGDYDLRHILHSAWRARWALPREAPDKLDKDKDPVKFAKRTRELADAVAARKAGSRFPRDTTGSK